MNDDEREQSPETAGAPPKKRWKWGAPGAVLLDYAHEVRKLLLLGLEIDDLSIERTKPLLERVQLRMIVQSPSNLLDTGRELPAAIDRAIARRRNRARRLT